MDEEPRTWWHCPACGKEWSAPPGKVALFHRCTEKGRRTQARIAWLPDLEEHRQELWRSLVEGTQ